MKNHKNITCYLQYFINRLSSSDCVLLFSLEDWLCYQAFADVELDGINNEIRQSVDRDKQLSKK